MRITRALAIPCLLLLCRCGNPDNEIVGLMISPVKTEMSIGGVTGFSAYLQYVDEHKTPVSNVEWSIDGTASLIIGETTTANVSVQCVRPSDYFAGGYVGDTVQGKAEINGKTYSATASLVCR